MNEAQTRLELITPALRKAGWSEQPQSRIEVEFAVTPGPVLSATKRGKPKAADYVLSYKGRYLAVIEAKARDKYYTEGLGQAKEYAEMLDIRFAYATNGLQIYAVDMETGEEGDVEAFPGPEALWALCFPGPQDEEAQAVADWEERFFAIPYEDKGGTWRPRYYQRNAIYRVLSAIAGGGSRLLLTLATGTGKTAIAFQIAWKLYHARWNLRRDGSGLPRILFLADRNLLADQAFNAFSAFEEEALVRISPDEIRRRKAVPTSGSIYFTIFQTFMSGPEDSPYFGDYPPDFFDLIIVDECHRGGARDESSWRAILEYFAPAVQLGLTATPRRDVNRDTYAYFGEPLYSYALKTGINDGYLTPFRVREINTTIDEYQYTADDALLEGEVDPERVYTESDFNRNIELREREAYRVRLLMEQIGQQQKTLVFCATQAHAALVRDLINQQAASKNPNYCHRVTADDGGRGEQHLRDFQDNEKRIPTVLTTSYKLSTGVDAPEVRNIVLLRPIHNMVEFKQIIGRGTRLFDGKGHFTIYDFVRAHALFKDPEWDGGPQEPAPVEPGGPNSPAEPLLVKEPAPCMTCGQDPCTCDSDKPKMVRVKLAEHKVLELDSMMKTSFWDPSGTPITAEEFLQQLYGDLPDFFASEAALRALWAKPDTRRHLLEELSERGYGEEQLHELQKLVRGQESDLFDVLIYVAYTRQMLPRLERAQRARVKLRDYDPQQQRFLNFVLDQYIANGVQELDDAQLAPLLKLQFGTIDDAKRELGAVQEIRDTFVNFQEYLYPAG